MRRNVVYKVASEVRGRPILSLICLLAVMTALNCLLLCSGHKDSKAPRSGYGATGC